MIVFELCFKWYTLYNPVVVLTDTLITFGTHDLKKVLAFLVLKKSNMRCIAIVRERSQNGVKVNDERAFQCPMGRGLSADVDLM